MSSSKQLSKLKLFHHAQSKLIVKIGIESPNQIIQIHHKNTEKLVKKGYKLFLTDYPKIHKDIWSSLGNIMKLEPVLRYRTETIHKHEFIDDCEECDVHTEVRHLQGDELPKEEQKLYWHKSFLSEKIENYF
jgi:hypothetical protein